MNTVNKEHKRLTKKGGYTKELDLTQELGYSHIYNRLAKFEDKIENGTLVELPSAWLYTLKLMTCASICYMKIKNLIISRMGQSKDIADLFLECPTVQGMVNDFALKDLAEANIDCNKIVGFEEILNAMPRYKKIVEAKLKELQGEAEIQEKEK